MDPSSPQIWRVWFTSVPSLTLTGAETSRTPQAQTGWNIFILAPNGGGGPSSHASSYSTFILVWILWGCFVLLWSVRSDWTHFAACASLSELPSPWCIQCCQECDLSDEGAAAEASVHNRSLLFQLCLVRDPQTNKHLVISSDKGLNRLVHLERLWNVVGSLVASLGIYTALWVTAQTCSPPPCVFALRRTLCQFALDRPVYLGVLWSGLHQVYRILCRKQTF